MTRRRAVPVRVRYSHVGREKESVYIAAISNGMIKVGFTDNPLTRAPSLDTFVLRKLGEEVVRFEYFPESGGRDMERLCLAFFRTVAIPHPLHSEFFSGVSFAFAHAAMKDIVAQNLSSLLRARRSHKRAFASSLRKEKNDITV